MIQAIFNGVAVARSADTVVVEGNHYFPPDSVEQSLLVRLLRHRRIRPLAFTMHSFMDAADVAPAWAGMQRGQTSDDQRIAATQQRLRACFYTMAHSETGELVPACVQHAVLDPAENAALRTLLPMPTRRAGA